MLNKYKQISDRKTKKKIRQYRYIENTDKNIY